MKLVITTRAEKDLAKLERETRQEVYKALLRYTEGQIVDALKLKGMDNHFRIRVGDYRIIIKRASENITFVYALRVLHRREAYR